MPRLRDFLCYAMTVALGLIVIVHTAFIIAWGQVTIYERIRPLAILETILGLGILGLGIERIRHYIILHKRGGSRET